MFRTSLPLSKMVILLDSRSRLPYLLFRESLRKTAIIAARSKQRSADVSFLFFFLLDSHFGLLYPLDVRSVQVTALRTAAPAAATVADL